MNNKNITILTIGILTLAIAILVLTIFKGNEMKEWFKKNVFCCFGKEDGENKVIEIDNYNTIATKEIDRIIKNSNDVLRNNKEMKIDNQEITKLFGNIINILNDNEQLMEEVNFPNNFNR
jgi:hypothetical protein